MIFTGRPDTDHRASTVSLARDLVLLLARIGLGVLMVVHAKLEYDIASGSITGVGALFQQSGVPLGTIAGPVNVLFEFIGGAAMILGLAVVPVGVLMALNMVGAWIFVHTGSLVLAVSGSGRFGLDHLLLRRVRPQVDTASGAGAAAAGR
jgi:putative oxidoreductase